MTIGDQPLYIHGPMKYVHPRKPMYFWSNIVPHRLPPLSALRLFEAAARLLSFKKAAEELLLTPSAVSHGIQTLEEWLGVELFVRTARGLSLTEAGNDYYPVVRDALNGIAAGTKKITVQRSEKRLSVSAAPTFAARWLLPRLQDFRQLHPDIAIAIDTSHDLVGFDNADVDLAIRKGGGEWEGIVAEKILTEELVPVCAPSIADRVGDFRSLDSVPLIHVTKISDDWSVWADETGHPRPDPSKGLQFDTIQMAFDAAIQGLGVALGRKPLVDMDIKNGRLVEIGQPSVTSKASYWLVCSPSRISEPEIASFRSWLIKKAVGPVQSSPSQ